MPRNVTITPTLFIGFGGTGANVLKKLKFSIARHFGTGQVVRPDDVPPCFSFLEVDTDSGVTGAAPENELRLSDSEFLLAESIPAGKRHFSAYDDLIGKNAREPWKTIRQQTWWPRGFGSILDKTLEAEKNGAFQIRQLGRICLWSVAQDFHTRVQSLVSTLGSETPEKIIASRGFPITLSGCKDKKRPVNVFVVASLAGGTGCGMLLDGLALVRDALRKAQYGDSDCVTHAVILMPSCYYKIDVLKEGNAERFDVLKALQINAYATFKELDYLYSSGTQYSQDIFQPVTFKDTEVTPATFPFVVTDDRESGPSFDHNTEGISKQVADFLANLNIGNRGNIYFAQSSANGIRSQVTRQTGGDSGDRPERYSSFGITKLSYPYEEIKRYAEHHVAKRFGKLLQDTYEKKDGRDLAAIAELVENKAQGRGWKNLLPEYDTKGLVTKIVAEDFSEFRKKDLLKAVSDKFNGLLQNLTNKRANQRGNVGGVLRPVEEDIRTLIKTTGVRVADVASYVAQVKNQIVEEKKNADNAHEAMALEAERLAGAAKLAKTAVAQSLAGWFVNGIDKIRSLVDVCTRQLECAQRLHETDFRAAATAEILAFLDEYLGRLSVLDEEAKKVWMNGQREERAIAYLDDGENGSGPLIEKDKTGECFGCSKEELKAFEIDLKKFANDKVDAIRRALCAEGNAFLAWPQKVLSELVREALDLCCKDEGFLPPFQKHVAFKQRGIAEGNRLTAAGFLFSKIEGLASPMISSMPRGCGGIEEYGVFAQFSGDEFRRVCGADFDTSPTTSTLVTTDFVGKYSIMALSLRKGFAAEYISELEQGATAYAENHGIPRPKKFPGLSAHLLDGADCWRDIFEAKRTVDGGAYIALAKELGLLVKANKGNHVYFYSKLDNPRSEIVLAGKQDKAGWFHLALGENGKALKPEQGRDCVAFWNGEPKVAEAFQSDKALTDTVRERIVAELCARFAGQQGEYALFTDNFKKANKMEVPSEIDIAVKRNQNWS